MYRFCKTVHVQLRCFLQLSFGETSCGLVWMVLILKKCSTCTAEVRTLFISSSISSESHKIVYRLSVYYRHWFWLQEIGEQVYTIPEVVHESCDKATRQRLQVLPYTLNFKKPSAEAIVHGEFGCENIGHPACWWLEISADILLVTEFVLIETLGQTSFTIMKDLSQDMCFCTNMHAHAFVHACTCTCACVHIHMLTHTLSHI